MRSLFFLVFTVCFSFSAFAQSAQQYSRAKIYLDAQEHTILKLSALGIAVDHGESKKGVFFTSDFSATELQSIRNAGFKVEILIPDVVKHYQEQNTKTAQPQKKTTSGVTCDTLISPPTPVPTHFHLGSYGGFFTDTEMLNILDSMHLLYPNLISARIPIDTFHSVEGRTLFYMRVSNNPNIEQPAKPQMMYTALHHAREPGSLSSTIFFLWHLLEHYATDPQIQKIIDNTELYFMPCVNPDGYIFNIINSPGGGGMWRKNRRNNGDGTFGVDINRNYGYFWGYDNIGSSNMTSSDTYRGPSGFSEPETRAVKWMAEHHNFPFMMNYHTFSNDIVYPWGYEASFKTPDSLYFDAVGMFLTQYNHYKYGTGDQTVGYVTNGDSDDWGYGEQTTKNKIFSMTPEIGDPSLGFYPPDYQIIPDCQNNLLANINVAALLLSYATLTNTQSSILTQQSGYLHYNIQRLGLHTPGTYTVTAQSLDAWLNVSATPKVYNSLNLLQKVSDSISYTANATTPNGQSGRYVLKINNGYYDMFDTVQVYYGKYSIITNYNTNSIAPNWTSSTWGISNTVFFSPSSSITDSPLGNYNDNDDVTVTTITPIDLTHATRAYLQFHAKWAIEERYDYVTVNAAPHGTTFYQPLCGRYTRTGGISQLTGMPLYDAMRPDWVTEQMDLADYLGQKIDIRFELVSDPFTNFDGYYFDDLRAVTINDSPTTVTQINTTSDIYVYPNPAIGTIHLQVNIPTSDILQAILYDCVGREVMTTQVQSGQNQLPVSNIPSGMYYLKIYGTNHTYPVQKIEIR